MCVCVCSSLTLIDCPICLEFVREKEPGAVSCFIHSKTFHEECHSEWNGVNPVLICCEGTRLYFTFILTLSIGFPVREEIILRNFFTLKFNDYAIQLNEIDCTFTLVYHSICLLIIVTKHKLDEANLKNKLELSLPCLGGNELGKRFYFFYKDRSAFYLGKLIAYDSNEKTFTVEFVDRQEPNEFQRMKVQDLTKDQENEERFFRDGDGSKCGICYDESPSVIYQSECNHHICSKCFTAYVDAAFSDGSSRSGCDLKCFQQDCEKQIAYTTIMTSPFIGLYNSFFFFFF